MSSPALPEALAAFAEELRESSGSGVILVVAHPDDETIGIGGHLPLLAGATIVHVTDGSPRNLDDARAAGFDSWQAYAAARAAELRDAMAEAGVPAANLISLAVPDQEARLAIAPTARELARLFSEGAARFVLTHPFEGGHPDHDAVAMAVYCACRLIGQAGATTPARIEMAFYHLAPRGPVFQDFLPEPAAPALEIRLGAAALARKQRMLACHRTQRRTLSNFGEVVERFRLPPDYDFTALPNGGRLLYRRWGIAADEQWPALARQALQDLGLSP